MPWCHDLRFKLILHHAHLNHENLAPLTLEVSMAHGGIVLLLSSLIVGLGAEFDICFPAGSPLPRESQVDASGAVLHVNALCGEGQAW